MLRSRFKRLSIKMLIFIIKPILYIFYDRKYLKGRWFEDSNLGWKWCIKGIWNQKIFGERNKNVRWPVSQRVTVMNYHNIVFHPDNLDNFHSPGCYFQASKDATIVIGKGTYIGPNVGLITSNHDPYDLDKKLRGEDIILGDNCWIGMNSVILPGVKLGDRTIIAAGTVVTKSFPEGYQVIAGVPARQIKKLKKEQVGDINEARV